MAAIILHVLYVGTEYSVSIMQFPAYKQVDSLRFECEILNNREGSRTTNKGQAGSAGGRETNRGASMAKTLC